MNHCTYVLAGDGDLMERVVNRVTFSEDVQSRFQAYGWHVQQIDGHDPAAVDAALTIARAVDDRPSLVMASTSQAHGAPIGVEDLRLTKRAFGWPEEGRFYVPEEH